MINKRKFLRHICHYSIRKVREDVHQNEKRQKERKKSLDRKKSWHIVPWDLNSGHRKWSVETMEVAYAPLAILGTTKLSPYLFTRYGDWPNNMKVLKRFIEGKVNCMRFLERPANCEECCYHWQENPASHIAMYQRITGAPVCPFTKPNGGDYDL